jgi:hypothetical protein
VPGGETLLAGTGLTPHPARAEHLAVEDFDPARPFPEVLLALRAAASAGRLPAAVDLFLLAWRPVLARQAHVLVHARNLDFATWADDALSVVMMEVSDRLPGLVCSDVVVQNLMAFLRRSVTRAWDAYLDSTGGLDGRTSMSTVHRRRMRLATMRTRWIRWFGSPPSDDQAFLDWANVEQARTHKDPARSGMIFTAEDLQPRSRVQSDAEGVDSAAAAEDDPGDGPLSQVDRKRLAALVIDQARRIDPLLGRCAQVVFDTQTTDDPGPLATAGDVAAEMRIRNARAALLLGQVHALAREILASQFAINGPDDRW